MTCDSQFIGKSLLLDATLIGTWLGYNLRQLAITLTGLAAFQFALLYTGRWNLVGSGVRWLMTGYLVFALVTYVTDPVLHLSTIEPGLSLKHPYIPFVKNDDGIGHMISYVGAAILMFSAMGVFISIFSRVSRLYQIQIQLLIAALVSPFMVGYLVAYPLTRRGIAPDLAWNMFGVAISNLVLGIAVFKTRLPAFNPASWGEAEHVPSDLAIVVDGQGRVVESNGAARHLLRIEPNDRIKQHHIDPDDREITLEGRRYEICHTPLLSGRGGEGVLLTLHDITERAASERQLRSKQQELLELQEELRQMAFRDSLTGLYNRRYLDAQLRIEVEDATRCGEDFSLVLLDLDHFRDINARYGYAGGDTVLNGVGVFLNQIKPSGASACRYGGEEFCVLLPHRSLDEAERLALEWQELMKHHVFDIQDNAVEIRLSAACSSLQEHGAEGMLLAADDALREAKRKGRNRVIRARIWNPRWGQGWV
jgi:diguanylate cyclase (GGDEF)-like protein